MWQQESSKDGAGPAAQAASAGPSPGKDSPSAQLSAPPGGANFVEFTPDGHWNGQQVADALAAQTTVPDDLKAAILAGPKATATYCVQLRNRVTSKADPSKKLETETIVGALTSRITELVYATSRSPLQYGQLADVARWAAQYPASADASKAPAGGAAPDAHAGANGPAEAYATQLAGAPGARITSGGKDQIRGIDFKNTTNDEHAGEDSGNAALAGWRFLRDPFDNTVTAVRPDGTGVQFTYTVEQAGDATKATLSRTEELSKLRVGALKRQDKMAPMEQQESEAGRKARLKTDNDNFEAKLAEYKKTHLAEAEAYEKAMADYTAAGKPKPLPQAPAGYPPRLQTTACTETPGTVYHAAGGDPHDGFPFTPPKDWKSFRPFSPDGGGPKPGDVYYLWDLTKNRGAHMGVFKSSSAVPGSPGLESWIVTDGGQGNYDQIQLAQERTRGPYNPKTGKFSSSIAEAGQDKGDRKLVGWVDIDAYFAEQAAARKP